MYEQRHEQKEAAKAYAAHEAAEERAKRLERVMKEADSVVRRCEAACERHDTKLGLKAQRGLRSPDRAAELEKLRLEGQLRHAKQVADSARANFDTFDVTAGMGTTISIKKDE